MKASDSNNSMSLSTQSDVGNDCKCIIIAYSFRVNKIMLH